MIKLKRIYEEIENNDGVRILVDRLWPRGVSKESAKLDFWMKEVAPSTELRKWFGHDPEKWESFRDKYKEELMTNKEALEKLKEIVKKNKNVTLLFAAKDELHNEAIVLKEILES